MRSGVPMPAFLSWVFSAARLRPAAHQALVHLGHVRQCCSHLACVCTGQVLLQRDECCCVGVMWVYCNPVCVCAVLCPPSCGWFAADVTPSGWWCGVTVGAHMFVTNSQLSFCQLYHNMSAVHAVGWCCGHAEERSVQDCMLQQGAGAGDACSHGHCSVQHARRASAQARCQHKRDLQLQCPSACRVRALAAAHTISEQQRCSRTPAQWCMQLSSKRQQAVGNSKISSGSCSHFLCS
jgi:hypothetical protein